MHLMPSRAGRALSAVAIVASLAITAGAQARPGPHTVRPPAVPAANAPHPRADEPVYTHTTVTGTGWYHHGEMFKGIGWRYVDVWAHVSYLSDSYIKVDDTRWYTYQWGAGTVCAGAWNAHNVGASPVGDTINHQFVLYDGHCNSASATDANWHSVAHGQVTINDKYWYRGGCAGGFPSVEVVMHTFPGNGMEVLTRPTQLNLTHKGCG
jgi:hypothetical protein